MHEPAITSEQCAQRRASCVLLQMNQKRVADNGVDAYSSPSPLGEGVPRGWVRLLTPLALVLLLLFPLLRSERGREQKTREEASTIRGGWGTRRHRLLYPASRFCRRSSPESRGWIALWSRNLTASLALVLLLLFPLLRSERGREQKTREESRRARVQGRYVGRGWARATDHLKQNRIAFSFSARRREAPTFAPILGVRSSLLALVLLLLFPLLRSERGREQKTREDETDHPLPTEPRLTRHQGLRIPYPELIFPLQ